jgi:hypothetical protein
MRFDSIKELIRPAYNALGDLKAGYPEKRNILLKDKYNGKRCIILGTSRQLNLIDLAKLKAEHTFACNFFHRHPQFTSMNLDFYSYTVPIKMLIKKAINNNRRLPFYDLEDDSRDCHYKLFANALSKKYIETNGLMEKVDMFYVKSKGPTQEISTLQVDPTRRMHFMDGAIFFMVAMAIYMGFSEIFLLGAGYTHKPTQHLHFYDPDAIKRGNLRHDMPIQPIHVIMEKYIRTKNLKVWNVLPNDCDPVYYSGISQKEFEEEFSCSF